MNRGSRHIDRRQGQRDWKGTTTRNRDVNRAKRDRAHENRQRARDNNAARERRDRNVRRHDARQNAQHRRVHFSNQQRVRMRNYYRGHRHHFHRVARVAWPIVIGGFVPRDYEVYDVPSDFYGYVPGYEGYKYIVVGDELIIIDPETWEIVAVIPL